MSDAYDVKPRLSDPYWGEAQKQTSYRLEYCRKISHPDLTYPDLNFPYDKYLARIGSYRQVGENARYDLDMGSFQSFGNFMGMAENG